MTAESTKNQRQDPRPERYNARVAEPRWQQSWDEQGIFAGRSTNYSGAGFSEMTFNARSLSQSSFNEWVTKVQQSDDSLSFSQGYQQLAEPSVSEPVHYFSEVSPELYQNILDSFRKAEMSGGVQGENGGAEHGEPMNAEAVE